MGEDNYGINAYGCADALNILYTLNRMPQDAEERKAFAEALQSMQEKDTGYFREGSHHIIHTTAHCTAALELLDARPIYPFYEMQKYKDFSEFEKYAVHVPVVREMANIIAVCMVATGGTECHVSSRECQVANS